MLCGRYFMAWMVLLIASCAEQASDSIDAGAEPVVGCPSGQVSCDDEGLQVKICNDDNETFSLVPCSAQEFCREGACFPQVCEPNASGCVGRRAQVCNGNGSGYVGGSGTNCEAAGLWCRQGACVRELCEPECDETQYCSSEGECLARICEPNERSCSVDNEARQCDDVGSDYVETIDCSDQNKVCVGGQCMDSGCGNGVLEDGERCDDGNLINTDACTNACEPAVCGDGIPRADLSEGDPGYEACDDGNDSDEDACVSGCVAAGCGDGIHRQDLEPGSPGYEACDDGNESDEDACLSDCSSARCGDGVVRLDLVEGEAGYEACDDGNLFSNDACTGQCLEARCGDDWVHVGVETCDDGDQDDTNGCTNGCLLARCGDGDSSSGPRAWRRGVRGV